MTYTLKHPVFTLKLKSFAVTPFSIERKVNGLSDSFVFTALVNLENESSLVLLYNWFVGYQIDSWYQSKARIMNDVCVSFSTMTNSSNICHTE